LAGRARTDQCSAETYTTEVVLQGFNSNLTMLDGRGSSFAGDDMGGGNRGGDFGAIGLSSGSSAPRRAGAPSGPRNNDIPF
jgi:single-strand DNA-binding protein